MSSETPKIPPSGPKDGDSRLSNASLHRLPSQIRRPAYDRSGVTPGIVHLGIGAFHRAHQAVVIDDLLADGATDWESSRPVCAVRKRAMPSLRRTASTPSLFAPARAPITGSSARFSHAKSPPRNQSN